jgi:predicted transcriptional regulator YdeE
MQKASTDCPAIWQAFGPQIVAFPNSATITEAYGVSVMLEDDGSFDYWAAVETPTDNPVPEGMTTFELPAGLYASAYAPNLEQVEAAWREIYMEWPQKQSEYAIDMSAPCLEVYLDGWRPSDPLELLAPVVKKT